MQVPGFLHSRTFKVSAIALVVVLASGVMIKSQTAAPSLSSATNGSSQDLAHTAGLLVVNPANASSLGGDSAAGSIQGQSTAGVQASGQIPGQVAATPQTPGSVQQSVPPTTDVQQPIDQVRPHATSSPLKGTVTIRDTGSTNARGWTLYIYTDGSGALSYMAGSDGFWNNPNLKQFSDGYFDVSTLAHLIANVGSMNRLQPSGSVMKSASFGTSEYATYLGAQSGDLLADYSATSNAKQELHDYLLVLVRRAQPAGAPEVNMPIIEP